VDCLDIKIFKTKHADDTVVVNYKSLLIIMRNNSPKPVGAFTCSNTGQ